MARYRKVHVNVWRDGFFSILGYEAKLLWLYLIASPQTTSAGLFCFDLTRAVKDTTLPRATFDGAFREILRQATECMGDEGVPAIKWDQEDGVVWLPNFLRYNVPESPNVVVSWRNYMDEIPETTPLLPEWYSATKAFMEGKGKGFAEAFGKVCPHPYVKAIGKPMPNPDPNPEPDPEQDTCAPEDMIWRIQREFDVMHEGVHDVRASHPQNIQDTLEDVKRQLDYLRRASTTDEQYLNVVRKALGKYFETTGDRDGQHRLWHFRECLPGILQRMKEEAP